ncbi:Hemimethylated DNA-binding protein YccV like-domain-containing protein [Lentinula guzmanii]|uniref:Hemimethylated DNA-binding protein YccV like-domain-containing protein n=1 Tax=Lentinula guzmanii TaxID=2804957 RepID=A0AA38JDV4_9AGAR|nr:Hemimethylated DNA-binding protein YccV like-domain-containing protein [Lentinula guzmanii]
MVPSLPLDVLVHILYQLPPSRDRDGEIAVKTIVQCSFASVLFRQAAAIPSIWQQHYQVRYLHANEPHEDQRKARTGGHWKLMYAERRTIDKEVLKHLDSIVMKRVGRYEHANALTKYLFDAWDVLEIEKGMVSPGEYMKICTLGESHTLLSTKAYWASALLTSIGQTYVVGLWSSLRLGGQSVSFVPAFSSISCFFGKHPDEISSMLTTLNSRCKEYLLRLNFPLSESDPNYDLKKLCLLICDFMATEGYGPVADTFHDVLNLFPHSYLTSHKRTIPLSLVHIFVSIAQSLGVASSPVDFPVRVLVHISVPNPEVDDFYVDVFGSETILSLRDIPALLARQGIQADNMMHYISPCGAASMLLRGSRNILSSLNIPDTPLSLLRPSALLALTISVLLTGVGGGRIVYQLISQADPLDCATFISEALIPILDGTGRVQDDLRLGCQKTLDEEVIIAQEIRLRSSENKIVQHFVGMLFEHRRYNYTALITGWDVSNASESWIREMKVSDLPRGREQPFYHVVCMDSSSCYVAEDNIEPLLTPQDPLLKQMCQNIDILPKLFTGVLTKTTLKNPDVQNTVPERRARFVLSPELSETYPDDEIMGDAWLTG